MILKRKIFLIIPIVLLFFSFFWLRQKNEISFSPVINESQMTPDQDKSEKVMDQNDNLEISDVFEETNNLPSISDEEEKPVENSEGASEELQQNNNLSELQELIELENMEEEMQKQMDELESIR